ncbi:conserved hypothetical protein [Trichinella spiralis]|uniref:hypothetical protein n=1 Tax=Trichinella spiralis TaxID=6334 RepID=UPI0001EFD4A5|nr:conserved hypothetical protein [Trichinella spiralis]
MDSRQDVEELIHRFFCVHLSRTVHVPILSIPVVELGILAGSAQRNWISSSTLTEKCTGQFCLKYENGLIGFVVQAGFVLHILRKYDSMRQFYTFYIQHISQREGGSDQKLLPLKFHAVVDKLWKWNQHNRLNNLTPMDGDVGMQFILQRMNPVA